MKLQKSRAVGEFILVSPESETTEKSGFVIKESGSLFQTGTVVSSQKEDIKEGDIIKYSNGKQLDTNITVVEYKSIVAITN